MQTVTSTPIIGLPGFDGWSQVITNHDQSFICVFAISGDNAANVGKSVIDLIDQKYPETTQELHTVINQVKSQVEDKGCKVQLAAMLIKGDTSSLGVFNGRVYLKRKNRVGKLLSVTNQIQVVEGKVFTDDVFIIMTQQAESFIEEIKLKFEQGYDSDTIIANIVPSVRGSEQSSLMALSFTVIGETEAEEMAPETDEEKAENLPLVPELISESVPEVTDTSYNKVATLNNFFKNIRFGNIKFGNRDVYLGQSDLKKNLKRFLPVVAIVAILLMGLFYFRFRRQQQRTQANQALAPLVTSFEEAKSLAESDPIASREQLSELIDELGSLHQGFAKKKVAQAMVAPVLDEAKSFYENISGKEEFEKLPIAYDLTLADQDFIATATELSNNSMYFVDGERRKIIKVNLETKEYQVFELNISSSIVDFALNNQKLFLLTDQAVYTYDVEDQSLTEIRKDDEELAQAKKIDTFGDTFYVLNQEKANIYRFKSQEGEYQSAQAWIKSFQGTDYSRIKTLTIDGDVWLTDDQGHIFKLRTGQEQDFSLRGVADPFESTLILFTQSDDENLYLLESGKHRIVVLNKEGEFQKEIKSASLSTAVDLVVDEANSKGYVVSGSVIFQIDL